MRSFDYFLAVDWSGAKGSRHKGIALALTDADGGAPVLVDPGRGWSREDVLAILREDLPRNTLVGLDLGISLPHVDCGAYFPSFDASPADAKDLWALVDDICAGEQDLGAGNFVDHPDFAPYFRRHGGREGEHFRCDDAVHGRGRFRITEHAQAELGCKPYSNFNLVGAAQVGKSSLTGMRMLHRLDGRVPVWPIDLLPQDGSVVVEIYTALAALEAGRSSSRSKIRSYEDLNLGLSTLGSAPVSSSGAIDDHSSDALLTAAWLRAVANEKPRWQPTGLSRELAQTEGWTFGA